MEKMMEMMEKKSKKKHKMDESQYDDSYHWTKVKKDKHFYGHIKKQTLF